ncbi:MAG TPA: hypothetical protein VGI96_31685 [Streptosporangiaceae bacterium]|jgi:hypothetical protein
MGEWRGDAGQPSPREIVTRLHEQIAAFSPEHAALVAEFERTQAEQAARQDGDTP